ncbi:MAG: S24/S26 family peptidase [Alloprevotella sp.]|nr:S24/S26 family peptidase [Alloprevotella sp.]
MSSASQPCPTAAAGGGPHAETFEEALRTQGFLAWTVSGDSMLPLLRERRDVVIIRPLSGRLRKYDVALFRYRGRNVLHRIVAVHDNGYTALGDHNIIPEHVPEE